MQVLDVRLLRLPEQNVAGLCIGSAVSCCMIGDLQKKLKGAVCMNHMRLALLHGSEAQCQKESEMAILRRTERSMVRQCVEYSSKIKEIYIFDVHVGFE